MARTFKVTFKNNEVATARLLQVSNTQDIAVLKLDGYVTPYLEQSESHKVSQADQVYAIGSPLGQSDSITSGIITRLKSHELITDATILPGNSGGPLINKYGQLIGVNTQKFMSGSAKGSEGVGIAIPITDVFDEFANIISPKANTNDAQ